MSAPSDVALLDGVGDLSAPSSMTEPSSIVSANIPDWSREHKRILEWDPAKSLLASIRTYQRHAGRRSPLSILIRKICVIRHRFWMAVAGADIQLNCHIEGGLALPHPTGVVVHDKAQVGPNCLLLQGVTIGGLDYASGLPVLDGHVDVGAGAKILGPVHIGRHARIGANAVVLQDVPPYGTAVGIPARIVESKHGRHTEGAVRALEEGLRG